IFLFRILTNLDEHLWLSIRSTQELLCQSSKDSTEPLSKIRDLFRKKYKKKNRKKRLCVDYHKLNTIMKKDCYSLSKIDNILETLSGSTWFSSLDLASGFWQVELDEKD
ncbi:16270_t:CDS:2, partial [Funneliformis geosporum]